VASAVPSPTPNPNAMKFTLDVTLPAMLDVRSAEAAVGNPLAERIFAIPGVVMLFGTNDFLTVSRAEGNDWDPIITAVQQIVADEM
jgi:Scaffold protein Nfu/NifU N terminal